MSEILGSSELLTGVDLKGLDAGLARAEARILKSTAVMQAMLDRLHADLNVGIPALEALAARGIAIPSTGGPTGQSSTTNVRQAGQELWGVRGPQRAGSLENPVATVLMASKFYPVGGRGAAIADGNQSDEQRGEAGFATTSDMAALTAAVADLARNANPVNGLAAAGSQGIAEPGAAERTVVMLDRQNGDALGRAAAAMESVAASTRSSTQDTRTILTAIRSGDPTTRRNLLGVGLGSSPTRPGSEGITAADAATLAAALRSAAVARGATMPPVALTTAEAAKRLGVAPSRIYYLAGAGDLAGAQKVRGAWQIPESSVAAYIASSAAGGGGGGAGPIVPVALGGGGSRGGGGNNGPGLLSRLLWGGGGMLGLAGMGSLAAFGGLDPVHVLMTGLGIVGSAGTAIGGAGLLGLGAAGVMGAGMAADASGIGQAANDIKSVVQAQNALNQAVAVYGKNSSNAKAAQQQLNATLASFSPVARAAVLQAANTAQGFHQMFNFYTGPAESVGANILNQGMHVGETFLPTLGQSALTDAQLIRQGLQPLFTWLSGPEGLGIFQNLEHEFTQNLPYGINALDNGLEALLRIMNIASGYTGGFTKHLDDLFKKLNGMSNVQLEQVVKRLVDDFRVWEAFVKALGTDIFRLFNNDVGTGKSIIVTLTHMLQKLGEWENSVKGRQDLMTIFTVHKNEVQALLHLLPLLLDPLAKLYLTVAPAATTALTDLAKGITAVVKAIESIPGGSWILAIGLLGSRLGVLGRLLTGGGAAAAGGGAAASAAEGAGGGATAGALGGVLGAASRTGVGTAISGGIEEGTLGAASAAEGAGLAGLADAITGAGAAIAPLAAGLLPVLGAAGGIYGLVKLFGLLSGGAPRPTTSYSAGSLENLLRANRPGVLSLSSVPGARAGEMPANVGSHPTMVGARPEAPFTLADIANTKQAKDALQQWYDTAKSSVAVSKLNADQLERMAREGGRLAKIFPQDAQLINKLNDPIRKTVEGLNDVFKILTDRWHTDLSSGLGKIQDDFRSNLRLIASQIGLSSHQGEHAWKQSIDHMVADVTTGMLKGRIATSAGLDAINKVTDAGVKGQALTWQQQSALILGSIRSLYQAGKITPQTYFADVQQITQNGMRQVSQGQTSALQKQNADAKAQYNQGFLDKQGLDDKLHRQQLNANTQAAKDMSAWVATILSQMSAGGQVSVEGANAILTPLNTALKELGQKPVSLVTLQALNSSPTPVFGQFPGMTPLPGTGNQTPVSIPGAAGGGLYQIGAPGQGGRDNVPLNVAGVPVMVGAGEQVAVFNRHQQPMVNLGLSLLGYDGMRGLFSDVNTPNYLAGGGTIKTPHAAGGGAQGSLLNAAFRLLGIDANHYMRGKAAGASTPVGKLVPGIMGIEQQAARIAGLAWNPSVVAMLLSKESAGGINEPPSGSLHATGPNQVIPSTFAEYALPGHGDINNPLDNAIASMRYIKANWGSLAAMASAVGLFSSGYVGYTGGGFPFGRGGDRFAGRPSGSQDMGRIKSAMAVIAGLVGSNVGSGGNAGRMQELLGYWPQLWSISNPNLGQQASSFVTTTDALGNSIAPFINQSSVNVSSTQLREELGWENSYIGDLNSASGLARKWHPQVVHAAQKRRDQISRLRAAQAAKVKGIRAKINANLKQIAAYQKQVTQLNNKISAEQGKTKPNYAAISGWNKQIAGLNSKINALEKDNQRLGGAGTYVGTGGEIGSVQHEYASEIAPLQSEVTTLSGYASALAAIPGTVSGQSGIGGLLGPAKIQRDTLQGQLAQLDPSTLGAALAAAESQFVSSTSGGSSTLVSLLEQQNLTLAEQLGVSQAQYKVLADMPPYAGVFHGGGRVPGPVGAEMMARVQGGEIITPIGGTPPSSGVRVKIEDHRTRVWVDDVEQIVEAKTRKMASAAGRPRPGQRRGLIAPLR